MSNSKYKIKIKTKKNKNIKKRTIRKRNKTCVYTDEAKRLIKVLKMYKQKNKNTIKNFKSK